MNNAFAPRAWQRNQRLRIRPMAFLAAALLMVGLLQAPSGALAGPAVRPLDADCVPLAGSPEQYTWSWGEGQGDPSSFRVGQTLVAIAKRKAEAKVADQAKEPQFQVCGRLRSGLKSLRTLPLTSSLEPSAVTRLTLQLKSKDLGFWWVRQPAEVVLQTPGNDTLTEPLLTKGVLPSGRIFSATIAILFVGAFYGLLAMAVHRFYAHQSNGRQKRHGVRILDPVVVSAGSYGGASLANLQLLWFTLIVVGLVVYAWLITGAIADLSADVLWLLGIASGTKVVAASIGSLRERLSLDNWDWLVQQGMLRPEYDIDPAYTARWRDLVLDNGTLDPSRYQLMIFGVVIGLSLLFGNISVMASFEVPEFFRTLQGLSSGFYLFGKIVSPDAMTELDQRVADLRVSLPEGPVTGADFAYLQRTIKMLFGPAAVGPGPEKMLQGKPQPS